MPGMLMMPLPRSGSGPPGRARFPVPGLVALRRWRGVEAADCNGGGGAKVAGQPDVDPMHDRREQHRRDQRGC